MRRRPWILVLTVFIFATLFSLFVLGRYLNRSAWLRDQISNALVGFPGEVSIENATLRPTSLKLSGVKYIAENNGFEIYTETLNLNLDLSNLFRSKQGIERFFSAASISNFTFIIRPHIINDVNSQGPIEFKLGSAPRLSDILLSDGAVLVVNENNEPWAKLKSTSGWIKTKDLTDNSFSINSKLFEDSTHTIRLNGKVNLVERNAEIDIKADSLQLADFKPIDIYPITELGGYISLANNLLIDSSGINLAGNISLNEVSFTSKGNVEVDRMDLDFKCLGDSILISGDCTVLGNATSLNGYSKIGENSSIKVEAYLPSWDFGEVLQHYTNLDSSRSPDAIFESNILFEAELGKSWHANGFARADTLKALFGTMTDLNINLSISPNLLGIAFESIVAKYYGLDIYGQGSWTPKEDALISLGLDLEIQLD